MSSDSKNKPAPKPDVDAVVRVREEQKLARMAELPDLQQVHDDHKEAHLARTAELPDFEQVERDRAEQARARSATPADPDQVEADREAERLSRISPETLAAQRHEEELRQHAELIAAMKAQTEGSD